MSEQKIIAVAGATGAQGGGAARAILADSESGFAVRALTRNPDSPAARELAALGAEVVQADFYDEPSVHKAFEGAYGAFLVTNFWAHGSAEKEIEEINVLVRAAKAAGLRHVVWSTLEDTRELLPLEDERMPVLQGKYNVPHFDAKGEANDLFRQAGVPTTFLNTTFFFQGFLTQMGPQRGEDGVLTLTLPLENGKLMAGVDVADIGRTAFAVLKGGAPFVGQTVNLAGDHLTGDQYAEKLAAALGEPVRFQSVPYDVFRTFGIPAADELGNMFQYYGDFDQEFTGARDLDKVRELNPALKSFDDWLAENASQIKVS
ncbi:NmrA/HSCARG family protein [Streptomyces sp. NL15-2K]|uniref:NmrA/HSCARG family protein n=1 Tax=Streptomyces sp. NL15-2K TaxID=376149 RepID=UPI000F5635D3|nr:MULTISPECIES: NmrA/HSCARG family protein [Actinomycetes]WKX15708.1 NmrA/HSCARG family protein [Kutzneria buriramensis]GCB44389.1 HSCARG protein [Streptomyces sp. NL15-2K]